MAHRKRAVIPAAALVAALALPGQAPAQGLESARGFVRRLYAAYETGAPDYLGRQARAVFTPHLLSLIRRAEAATPAGDVGVLDGDPICDCQDAGGVRLVRLTVAGAKAGRARADVTLRFPDGRRDLRLDLASVHGAWRVADVHTRETPSLAHMLAQAAAQRVTAE